MDIITEREWTREDLNFESSNAKSNTLETRLQEKKI